MDLLAAVRQGFQGIDVDPAFKEKALQNLHAWLTNPDFAAYRPQIEWMIQAGKFSDLLDAFYQVLPFGTGGRRGAVGIGPNRMNLWTLGASVQGHCEYLKERFPGSTKPLNVVLAFDVRQFEDKRKVYNPTLPNPVLHLSSRDFAQYAAGVYAANGIHAHILPPDSQRYPATPELSFTIRFLQANGGLNVSASHNPPDDNGGKFYDERGGQPVPPDDQIMSDLVEQVTAIKSLPWAEAARSGKVHFLTDEPHRKYIELCRKQSLVAPPKFDELRLVFTPLHGVGSMSAMEVLEAQGFRPIPVAEQMEPNGQFPNVTKTPNPEVYECLDRAEAVGRKEEAQLVLATDPDADRLGGLTCTTPDGKGDFRILTGNDIATLLTHFKLSKLAEQGRLPASPIVVTTEVTTRRITRVARHFNAQVVDNLLVGFKYIADVLWQLEQNGAYEDVTGTPNDFIIAVEESHGALLTPQIRDKDAAAAALVLAEAALDEKRHGRTLADYLERLARQFGYFRNGALNIAMAGLEGRTNMVKMMDALRRSPPTAIGGLAVVGFEDFRDENGRLGPLRGATDASSRNLISFRLGEPTGEGLSARVMVRPSGTEPKAKAYIEVASAPRPASASDADWEKTKRAVDERVKVVSDDFSRQALATVGLTPEQMTR